jgi:sulfate transport system ATP-binding protein
MSINIHNICKTFDNTLILDNINLDIHSGELIALLGPSGSGKTTLLRIIAGLENADSGNVILDGKHIENQSIQDRNVGFVFQHYALFKHMTVFDNIAFGMNVRAKKLKLKKQDIYRKVMELLSIVHLNGLHDRYPDQLSGGQKQRVALARALAIDPKVMLLDEPFGALDALVRKELRRFMRNLHDHIHVTSIFVTHDQEEAMEVADRIVIMNQGKIEQVGTPEEIYNNPKNEFVYNFLGHCNLFTGWRDEQGILHFGNHQMGGKQLKVFARPHETIISTSATTDDCVKTNITHINLAGSMAKIELHNSENHVFLVEMNKQDFQGLNLKKGARAFLKPAKIIEL